MNYRVSYRLRITDDWNEAEFATFGEAYKFKKIQRAKLWIATIHVKHANGQWVGC